MDETKTNTKTVKELLDEFDAELRSSFESNPTKYSPGDISWNLSNMLYRKLFCSLSGSELSDSGVSIELKVADGSSQALRLTVRARTEHPLCKLGFYPWATFSCSHVIAVFQRKKHDNKMCICGLNGKEMAEYWKNTSFKTRIASMTPSQLIRSLVQDNWMMFRTKAEAIRTIDEFAKSVPADKLREFIRAYNVFYPSSGRFSQLDYHADILDADWRKAVLDLYYANTKIDRKEGE